MVSVSDPHLGLIFSECVTGGWRPLESIPSLLRAVDTYESSVMGEYVGIHVPRLENGEGLMNLYILNPW